MSALLYGLPGRVKTLLDRLTADRADKIDALDAEISSRAPASTALNNTVWTDERADKLDSLVNLDAPISGLSFSPVKKIIRGEVDAEGSLTISSVDLDRTMINSWSNGSAGYVAARGTVSLADGSNVNASFQMGGDFSGTKFAGPITDGETDLTTRQYHAYFVDTTTIYCTGPCRFEIVEFTS